MGAELDNQGVPMEIRIPGGINYDGSGENKIIITVRAPDIKKTDMAPRCRIDIPEGHIVTAQ